MSAAIEVEVDHDAVDSAYGDEVSSASTSLGSSILDYEWKHGRRYHRYRSGAYSFPNDEAEQERLDMVHHAYRLVLDDRLFLAPVQLDGLNILDIGTGTGIWAIDLGDQCPGAASILGIDLSPIQPDWVPQNVKFLVDDVEDDWIQPDKYDYIHCRYMAGSIQDWPRLVRQIYYNLIPGGWVEFQESANTLYSEDDTLKPDNALVRLMDGLQRACSKIGRTLDPAPFFKTWAKGAGFTHVEEKRFKLPVGGWPKDPRLKEIGVCLSLNFSDGVKAFTAVPFTEILGWSPEEVEILNMDVRAASRRKDVHAMFDFVVVTGQKPE